MYTRVSDVCSYHKCDSLTDGLAVLYLGKVAYVSEFHENLIFEH